MRNGVACAESRRGEVLYSGAQSTTSHACNFFVTRPVLASVGKVSRLVQFVWLLHTRQLPLPQKKALGRSRSTRCHLCDSTPKTIQASGTFIWQEDLSHGTKHIVKYTSEIPKRSVLPHLKTWPEHGSKERHRNSMRALAARIGLACDPTRSSQAACPITLKSRRMARICHGPRSPRAAIRT